MCNPLNISIVGVKGYPYVYGGYETFVKEISERLVQKNCNVTVYCHKSLFVNKPKKIKGINLIYIPSIETKILSQPIHSFFSIVHACFSKCDIIFVVNSANGPFGLITRIFNKPTVINVDGMEWLRPKWKGLGSIYFKFSSRLATIFYDQIINDSEEMKKVYLKLFNKESQVIAYGEKISKSKNSTLIKKFNLKKFEYYLVIGRLIPDNNSDLIIKSFLKTNSNKKLVIVGDVFYEDNYAKKLKKIYDERLIFTGYVNDQELLNELYCNCYVYIHGHEFGGTNPTLLKAMGTNSAILALDTKFNREVLENESFGILFKKSEKSLFKEIQRLDKNIDLVFKLKKESSKGLTEKYNWGKISDLYLNLFKKLIKNK